MSRLLEWLRLRRLWFVRQRNLRAQIVEAEHRVAALEVEHWFAMRAECERWKAMFEEVRDVSAAVRD